MKDFASQHADDRGGFDEALAHALAVLGSRPDVTGVDVGPKYVDGERMPRLCIRVHVREKLGAQRLSESARIPSRIFGIETDVITAYYRKHAGDTPPRAGRFDPMQPGISIGNPKAEAGTIGLFVYDKTGAPCLLGSYHVLAGPNATEGDIITQPACFDGGASSRDAVATLSRFPAPGPWGDAAIARLTNVRQFENRISGSNVHIDKVAVPQLDLAIEKSGRTTGVTRGTIEAMGTYFYPEAPAGIIGFRIIPDDTDPAGYSSGGDSGSLVYIGGTGSGVGLHCAGGHDPSVGEVGIACSLSRVLLTLGVSLRPTH